MRGFLWPMLAAMPLVFAAVVPAIGQSADGVIYAVTFFELVAAHTKDGLALLERYRDGARRESGNIEAELGQEIGRSSRFVVIEAWRGVQEFDAHEKSAATAGIRDALTPLERNPPDRRVNFGLDVAPPKGRGALLVATHVDVAPPFQAATETALKAEAAATRQEPGSLRWDVFQQRAPRTNHFNVVAFWRAEKDFDAHEATAHRAAFRATLAPMLGALYDERLYDLR